MASPSENAPSSSASESSNTNTSDNRNGPSPAGVETSDSTSQQDEAVIVKKDIAEMSIDWIIHFCKTIWQMLLATYRMICLIYTYPNVARHAAWLAYKAVMISYKYDLWKPILKAGEEKPKPPKEPDTKAVAVSPPRSGWFSRIGIKLPKRGRSKDTTSTGWNVDSITQYLTLRETQAEEKPTEAKATDAAPPTDRKNE